MNAHARSCRHTARPEDQKIFDLNVPRPRVASESCPSAAPRPAGLGGAHLMAPTAARVCPQLMMQGFQLARQCVV